MPPTIARMVVLPLLKPYLARHPEVEISIELSSSQLDFRAGSTDLAIRFGTGLQPGLISVPFLEEPVFPVASPAYLRQHSIAKVSDLRPAFLLRSTLEPWRPWFETAGLDWPEPDTGHRFEDLSLLYHAAANDLGVALARASLVQPLLDKNELVDLFKIKAASPYGYYLVYDKEALTKPGVIDLRNSLLSIHE